MIWLLLGTLAVIAACEALTRLYRRHLHRRTGEAFFLGYCAALDHAKRDEESASPCVDPHVYIKAQRRAARERWQ